MTGRQLDRLVSVQFDALTVQVGIKPLSAESILPADLPAAKCRIGNDVAKLRAASYELYPGKRIDRRLQGQAGAQVPAGILPRIRDLGSLHARIADVPRDKRGRGKLNQVEVLRAEANHTQQVPARRVLHTEFVTLGGLWLDVQAYRSGKKHIVETGRAKSSGAHRREFPV